MTTSFNPNDLYECHWDCDEEPKAIVLLIHGLNEHCGRYQRLADTLNKHQYTLYSFDLPSHGRSPGIRGHIDRFLNFEDGALYVYQQIKARFPDKPIFLLGHSMGGLISGHLLLNHQHLFTGALLSGPAFQSPKETPAWQVAIIKLISTVWPTLKVIKLDADGISRDPVVVKQYLADPLVNKGRLSARLMVELFYAMHDCVNQAKQITLPIKIMHGGEDVMTAPDGSRRFHDQIRSQDKSLTIYEGLFHEIFNEPESQDIFMEIIDWLNQH